MASGQIGTYGPALTPNVSFTLLFSKLALLPSHASVTLILVFLHHPCVFISMFYFLNNTNVA